MVELYVLENSIKLGFSIIISCFYYYVSMNLFDTKFSVWHFSKSFSVIATKRLF